MDFPLGDGPLPNVRRVTAAGIVMTADAQLPTMTGAYPRVVVDIGAGDGRFAVATARADPSVLVVAIDADQARLEQAWQRARRARVDNVLLIVAAADALPAGLRGCAASVHIHMPWGSLLRAVVGADPTVVGEVVGLAAVDGRITVLLSAVERDGLEPLDDAAVEHIAAEWVEVAPRLQIDRAGEATATEIAAAESPWAKRLRVGRERRAWVIAFRKRTG